MSNEHRIPRFFVAGVKINAVSVEDVVHEVDRWIRERHLDYAVLTNTHGVVEMQADLSLLATNNSAGITTPDGMPIVWLGRLAGFRSLTRSYGPDIMRAAFEYGRPRGYRHFLYGGLPQVAERLAERLRREFPDVEIVGTHTPPFRPLRPGEVFEVAEMINRASPDIVWCGLGCPKQDRWMAQFRPLLTAPVLVGVGAAFDFLSGRIRQAPTWIQNAGLEWLFRLTQEPKRLWPRYSRVIPKFIYYVGRDYFRKSRNRSGLGSRGAKSSTKGRHR